MRFFSTQIIIIRADFIPPLFKYRSSFCFYRIALKRFDLTIPIVLFPTFMIGVSSSTRISHLYELPCHIHAYKVVLLPIFFKQGIYLFCRARCSVCIFEAPVRKDFTFIRLNNQYTLFSSPNLVELRMVTEVDAGKILLIIKWTCQSGTVVKMVLTIVGPPG